MEQWGRLRCESDELPPLHVKATFSDKGYTIRLTDLSHVWGETLSKKEIFERARRWNCSVDPSEDNEQFHIFLEKLKSALSQDSETSAALSAANDGKLRLHLEAPLPSPLPAFEWEVNLELAPDGSIGDEVVSPLIHQVNDLNRRCQSLIAEIQAKDKIIYKTTDRLETSGHDLDAVFPGISKIKLSRKKSQREQLAAHIGGLGEFNEKAWAAQFGLEPNDSALHPHSVDSILASLPAQHAKASADHASTIWWQEIPAGQKIDLGGSIADGRASRMPDRTANTDGRSSPEEKEDDDFQVQATPPHLRGHSLPPTRQGDVEMGEADNNPPADDDSTEDEDDLDGPPQNMSEPASRSAKPGIADAPEVAEPEQASPPPKATHVPEVAMNHSPVTHDKDTEDEDDLDGPSQPSQEAPPAQLPARQKSQTPQPASQTAGPSPRKKLGTLEGRARTTSPIVEEPAPTISSQPTPTQPSHKPKPKPKTKIGTLGGSKAKPNPPSPKSDSPPPAKKLGAIGGKRATASTAAPASSRAATASTTPEPPRSKEPTESRRPERKAESVEPENQEERANAKRDALKRELEMKAKAPAKKKRKF